MEVVYIFRLEVKRKRSCLVCRDGCSSVSGSEWLHLGREGDVVERSRGTAELIPMVMIEEVEKVRDSPSFQIQLSILFAHSCVPSKCLQTSPNT